MTLEGRKVDRGMNKDEEKQAVALVVGQIAGQSLLPSEAPDYVMSLGKRTLGFEVTSLWMNDSSARLQCIPGYSMSLFDGQPYRHRDDRFRMKVTQAVLTPRDGRQSSPVTVIMQERPSIRARAQLLEGVLARKSAKYQAYKKRAESIDLVVRDCDDLFTFDQFNEARAALRDEALRSAIRCSPFREIHLVARVDGSEKAIPLRSYLFAEELLAFMDLARRDGIREILPEQNLLAILVGSLARLGYADGRMCPTPPRVRFHAATLDAHLGERGWEFQNSHVEPPWCEGEGIQTLGDLAATISESERAIVDMYIERRERWYVEVAMYWRVDDPNGSSVGIEGR